MKPFLFLTATAMKTNTPKNVKGILTTILLLTGAWLLNSCATQKIALPSGTPWRDVAKSAKAEQSTPIFSYRMEGRKYDLVTFTRSFSGNAFGVAEPSDLVVFEDGRLFAVMSSAGQIEWNRRFKECVKSGGLPLGYGVGPLHALVMEQRRLNQQKGFAEDSEESVTAVEVVAGAALSPFLLFIILPQMVGVALEAPFVVKSERQAQAVYDTLLDSAVSYASFLTKLPKPVRQTSMRSYQIHHYSLPFGGGAYYFHVGFRDGKVIWGACNSNEILMPDS